MDNSSDLADDDFSFRLTAYLNVDDIDHLLCSAL